MQLVTWRFRHAIQQTGLTETHARPEPTGNASSNSHADRNYSVVGVPGCPICRLMAVNTDKDALQSSWHDHAILRQSNVPTSGVPVCRLLAVGNDKSSIVKLVDHAIVN